MIYLAWRSAVGGLRSHDLARIASSAKEGGENTIAMAELTTTEVPAQSPSSSTAVSFTHSPSTVLSLDSLKVLQKRADDVQPVNAQLGVGSHAQLGSVGALYR